MSENLDSRDPASLANEYLEVAARIAEYEERQRLIKDNLIGLLPYEEGFKATYGEAFVLWAKGRRTEKVDTKALRRELILGGVLPEVVEKAFEKATTVSVGQPTMRISMKEDEA